MHESKHKKGTQLRSCGKVEPTQARSLTQGVPCCLHLVQLFSENGKSSKMVSSSIRLGSTQLYSTLAKDFKNPLEDDFCQRRGDSHSYLFPNTLFRPLENEIIWKPWILALSRFVNALFSSNGTHASRRHRPCIV